MRLLKSKFQFDRLILKIIRRATVSELETIQEYHNFIVRLFLKRFSNEWILITWAEVEEIFSRVSACHNRVSN